MNEKYSDSHSQEELEKIILGTILTVYKIMEASSLTAQDFTDMRNQVIFSVMKDLDESKIAIDYITVADHLKNKGINDGIEYLKRLREGGVEEQMFPDLVDILKENSLERKMKKR